MMRQSYTAVIERNRVLEGEFVTEPYECGWASEGLFFVRVLEQEGEIARTRLRVQISPDGMHWCDEGTYLTLTEDEITFCRLAQFGNWLRLAGEMPPDTAARVIVTLALKE